MIGKIVGAIAGSQIAKGSTAIGGAGGALLGAGAATVLRRASLPAMIAITAGGYFFNKHMEKRKAAEAADAMPPRTSKAPAAGKTKAKAGA